MIKKDSASDCQPESERLDRELLEQVKLLHQCLLEENRLLRELLATQGSARAAAAQEDYLDRWEHRRRGAAERLQAELHAGPTRFHVSHPGDPLCVVGAASGAEAISKYRRHFGIVQTSHEFTVNDVALADAEPDCLAAAN